MTAPLKLRLAFLMLASVACAPKTSTTALRFQVSGEREEVAVYEAVVDAFERARPGEKVGVVPVAKKDDHLAKLVTAFAAGDPPDVFLINYREYAQFAKRRALHPVGPLLRGVPLGDYYPQPVEAFTLSGELQCMPQNVSSLVVYYNRRIFENAGVPAPPEEWTWDDLRRTARALTRGGVHGLGVRPSMIRLAPFVWSNGGDIVDELPAPTRFTLDGPAAREALEFLMELVRDDRVVPTETDVAAQDLETRFVSGRLAMLLSSRRETTAFREVAGLDWDVAPLPVRRAPAGILHSDAYCISKASKRHPKAARFVAFATGDKGQTISALGGRTVPSLRRVAESGAFLDPGQPPERAKVFLDAIPSLRRTPVIPTWPQIEDVTDEILTRAFYEDGYTVDRALRDITEQTSHLFRRT